MHTLNMNTQDYKHILYSFVYESIYVPRLDSSCRHMDRAIHSDTYFATLIEYLLI